MEVVLFDDVTIAIDGVAGLERNVRLLYKTDSLVEVVERLFSYSDQSELQKTNPRSVCLILASWRPIQGFLS